MPTGLGDEKFWLCPTLDDSADDLSGNGNHGTYNGGMGTVADTSEGGSRAYDFDGINDYLSIPAIGALSSWSVSAWCYFDATGSGRTILTNDKSGWNDDVLIGISPEGSTFQPVNTISATHQDSNNQVRTTVSDSTTASTGTWYHLTITSDGSALKCYVDGTLENTTSRNGADLTFGNNNVYLGNDAENTGSRRLDGRLDDIRIFDRALSDTEITHLATSRGMQGNPYQFNGLGDEKLWLCPSLNDSADDLSGSGNHGTYNGGMGTVLDDSEGGIKAYSFDGSDDFIGVPDDATLQIDPSSGISISAWVYLDTVSGGTTFGATNPRYLLVKGDLSSPDYWMYAVRFLGSRVNFVWRSSSAWNDFRTADLTLTASSWTHIAVVHNTSSVVVYINGSPATTSLTSGNLTNQAVTNTKSMAVGTEGTQRWFDGKQDDIRIFDRALTTTEITALASKRGYRSLTGPHPHPLTVSIEHPLG